MTRAATPKLAGYTGLAALGLFLGLALRLPELVAASAPFAALVALALLFERQPVVDVRVELDEHRIVEGEETELRLDVHTNASAEVLVALPRELHVVEGENPFAVAALSHRLMLRPELWVRRVRPEDVVTEALDSVPTPAAEDVDARRHA